MYVFRFILLFIVIVESDLVYSQHVFVEEHDWSLGKTPIAPDSLGLNYKLNPENAELGDTVSLRVYYSNKQKAINGKYVLGKKNKRSKIGIWDFSYENGNLWSRREYGRRGRVAAIEILKSPSGKDLFHGFGRYIGENKWLTGYNYIYDESGQPSYVGRYSGGSLVGNIELSVYNEKQLARLRNRKFYFSEDEYIEELSFEEAYELQKESGKPILLHASNNWNGYSKLADKRKFSKKSIAKYINDNFILAYIDVEDTQPLSIVKDGQNIVLKGSIQNKPHDLVSDYVSSIKKTPSIIFFGPELEVLYWENRIPRAEEKFVKTLEFIASKEFEHKTLEEFMKK